MIDLLTETLRLLSEASINVAHTAIGDREALLFESDTILGFAFSYDTPEQLIERWQIDAKNAVQQQQLPLRRAGAKAWNTYLVLMAHAKPNHAESLKLAAIEEDLVATRKLARAGLTDSGKLRGALLPLLPIQNTPRLEPPDMPKEIRLRATDLPHQIVDVFLSNADDTVIAQLLEERL